MDVDTEIFNCSWVDTR